MPADENGIVQFYDYDSMYSTSINTTFSYINFNFCNEWCPSADSCGLANLNNQWVAKNDVDSGSVEEMTDDNGAITGI